jgi:predicted ester cyclase
VTNPLWAKKPGGSYVGQNRKPRYICLLEIPDGRYEVAGVWKEVYGSLVQPERGQRGSVLCRGRLAEDQQNLPAVGRKAIEVVAQDFMSAFPDMVVTMDGIDIEGDQVVYRWTLTGTNSGAGGTGQSVRISGHEKWTIAADGLIADSKGHFDDAEYNRQLKHGFAEGSENPGTRKSSSV